MAAKKEDDKRLEGDPGSVNRTTDQSGNARETKIGEDGRATGERHNTDHGYPKYHSDPHDHDITWEDGTPNFGAEHNYFDGNIPELKKYILGNIKMGEVTIRNTQEENRFKTISDFKWCMRQGGEVNFIWKGIKYFVGLVSANGIGRKIAIGPAYEFCDESKDKLCDTAEDALEYIVSEDRLRDVITQVDVVFRSI